MANNNKKETKVNTTKVCAILYTITTVLWIFTDCMKIYEMVEYGKSSGVLLITDIGITIVFGSLAVSYFCKWRKEKKDQEADVSVVVE
ncbi:MAG: hypothetical protein J5476_12805 [Lachnospiraceae bacterium]|nr:hypothetical protein [Lachnospiraceae bacterium]